MVRALRLVGASCVVLSLQSPISASISQAPDYDSRQPSQVIRPSSTQVVAVTDLASQIPDVAVDWDELLGTPKWIASRSGFLSGSDSGGRGVSAQVLAMFSASDPDRMTKAFLADHRELFGHGPEVLTNALVARRFVTAHNGLHTVVWQQQVDAIPVFDALLIAHVTAKGELVNLSSHCLPDPQRAAGTDTVARAELEADPPIAAVQAVASAARNIGESLSENEVSVLARPVSRADRHERFKAAPMRGEIEARLVWLPLDRSTLQLCWDVLLMSRAQGKMFRILINARTGQALARHCLTEHLSNASYLVFTSDSPTPMSPGYPAPTTNQPPQVARVLVVTNAFDSNASPNGWINDGDNQTLGNNVDAHLERDGQADLPRPQGSPNRVFQPPLDLTQDPLNYGDAAVVNLFYWNNWMHDKLYELGFTEGAGNFQSNNFSRGGLGDDAVEACAQTGGSGTINSDNNASFTTPPDGSPGVMQMFIWSGPTPNRDGDFDSQVILHEYTHGLSNRRVGGGVGITAIPQSRGLGEGWSDFYSLALLSQPGDDVNGTYPEGAYVSYEWYGSQENYYFGVRRYPYCTDMTKDPGTFKDIDPAQASPHTGIPCNPDITNSPATEIHNVGEIWCATLWDARANLVNQYGYATGNQLMLQIVTDAMNLTPANPTFIEARDAVLQADLVDTGGANYHELWLAFAKRGLGYGASAPASSTTAGIVESFQMPDPLMVLPFGGLTAGGAVTGSITPAMQSCTLKNTGSNSLSWVATQSVPWLDLSSTNGTLATNGASALLLVSLNAAAYALPEGVYSGAITFSNLATGIAQTRTFTLTLSAPSLYYFSLNSDPGWPRQGQWAFGQPTGQGGGPGLGSPDPTSGATGSNVFGVNLNGNYSRTPGGPYYLTAGPFNFAGFGNVMLQFERWLNSDAQPYASATIDASSDGTNWFSVFTNGPVQITDSAWTNCQYDISAFADNQPAVYVRWGYQISAGAFPYSGWNIDDIAFLGLEKLEVMLPASATKGNGILHNAGQVSLATAPLSDLTIGLISSDSNKLEVPATVIIPAGSTNVSFDLSVIDNMLLDGTELVSVSVYANNYSSGTNVMTIFDNETATLTLSLPASATEGDPPIQCLVNSSAAPAKDITVSLFSSDTNSLLVPASVVLPASQTSAWFNATIIQNNRIEGDRDITVTAHVDNWTDGTSFILIHDDKSTNLTLSLPAQVWASNGVLTNGGRIWIAGTLATNLPVSLTSSAANQLLLPTSVTIPSGQTSEVFNVTIVDNGQSFGTIPIMIDASAVGFIDGQATVMLSDDQTPPSPFNPSPPDLSTNNAVSVQLSWSPGVGEGVEQLANGGFESGSFTNWTVADGTNSGFILDDGTVNPPSGDTPIPPFAGNFCALADHPPPAVSVLSRNVSLPAGMATITLSWVDCIRNFASSFATNQQFRVELRDTNDVTLAVLYMSQPDDPLLGSWTQRSADLTGWAGRTVRLAFAVDAGLDFLDVHLDNVSVRAANLPPETYSVYFGTNSAPGPAQLLGSTTNTSWPLPVLSPLVAYYWQVVASRGNQTAGPVWEFSTLPTLSVSNLTVIAGYIGSTNALFDLQLDSPNSQPVTVNFATADGTGVAGVDYATTNGILVFNPGQTSAVVSVAVTGETSGTPGENFFLTLGNPVNVLLATNQAVCNILNGTNLPPVLASISNRTIHADYTLTFTAQGSDPDMNMLTYTLDPGAPIGASIDPITGIFTWTPNDAEANTTNTITVRVTDNGLPPLSATSTFTVTVVPRPQAAAGQLLAGQFTLTWSAIPGQAYRVQYTTNLNSPWINLPGDITASGGTATKVDPAAYGPERFYQVLVLP
jgi:Fungalysin metallopeptidase (M36)/Calx-beta domain